MKVHIPHGDGVRCGSSAMTAIWSCEDVCQSCARSIASDDTAKKMTMFGGRSDDGWTTITVHCYECSYEAEFKVEGQKISDLLERARHSCKPRSE